MDICTGESGSLSAPSPCQPRTGVAGRISARFPDRECYPLLHPVDPVPEWQAGYLQGFRTGSVIRSFTLSAPYLKLQSGYLHRFRTGSLSLHPLPVRLVPGRQNICNVSGPDRYHPPHSSFTLSAPYRRLQAGYLHRFRTGSLSAPSLCQPRTGVACRISAPFSDRIVIRSFTLSAPYRSGMPDNCTVSGSDRYHPSFTLSAPYRRLQAEYLQGFRTESLSFLPHPVSPVPEVAVRISAPFPDDLTLHTPPSPCPPRTGDLSPSCSRSPGRTVW